MKNKRWHGLPAERNDSRLGLMQLIEKCRVAPGESLARQSPRLVGGVFDSEPEDPLGTPFEVIRGVSQRFRSKCAERCSEGKGKFLKLRDVISKQNTLTGDKVRPKS